jgi:hypothetical protein
VASGEGHDDSGARGAVTTVFVADPTAEAGRLAQALRAAGYTAVDVPQSMLVARVAVQRPHVILVDADGDAALEIVARIRDLPMADDIHVLFLARPGGAIATPEEALAQEGSGLFVRPIDVAAVVNKVAVLTGGPRAPVAAAEPLGVAPISRTSSVPAPPVGPSLPPASMRGSSSKMPSIPSSEVPEAQGGPARGLSGLGPKVSAELQQLLSEAEQRANVQVSEPPKALSPEEEIEAVLPAELLATLDEPLDDGEDDDDVAPPPTRAQHGLARVRERTGDEGAPRTTGAQGTGGGATPHGTPLPRAVTGAGAATPAPGESAMLGTQAEPEGAGISTTGPEARAFAPNVPLAPSEGAPGASAADSAFPTVLGPGDALRVVGRAIASRTSGSLCLTSTDAELRVVLREGDVLICASTSADDTLLAFLAVRGDLPRETVRRLAPKFPAFGRHAGAALVARGYLSQDQMWPTLRAHAAWVLARLLQTPSGHLAMERQPAGRLAGEPSVFGGSTGAEVFVDVVRRIVSPAEAIERLGGVGARIGVGPASQLLGECALGDADTERMRMAAGRTLRSLVDEVPDGDLATVVFALANLGVLEVMRAVGDGSEADPEASPGAATIDAEAVRERVRARKEIVEDGDYFAVLGVAHDATGYEVRRAFLDLRRAFEPSRVLTPEVAELAEDVRKIVVVLEEAYEILKDSARRERYRNAIEAVPDQT